MVMLFKALLILNFILSTRGREREKKILTESVVFSSFNSIIKTLIGGVTFGRHFQLGLIGCI